MNPIKYYVSED